MKQIQLVWAVCLTIFLFGCNGDDPTLPTDVKQEMRNFVQGLSSYAKTQRAGFVVIPQNGQELVTSNGEGTGTAEMSYLNAIDGIGREDLFYGYNSDDKATPSKETDYMTEYLDIAKGNGVAILVTDYCNTTANMDDSYNQNSSKGYTSFAADHRELDNIPSYPATIQAENADDITTLSQAKNFLYLINPDNFASKQALIQAVTATNYDVLIVDAFFNETLFTASEISSLKAKANGGSRMVIAYMSIGEAEDYRFYWESDWKVGSPAWLEKENSQWKGNFKVRYWDAEWQAIIFGNDNSYLKKIIDAGFDGTYLDIIDAFEYFE